MKALSTPLCPTSKPSILVSDDNKKSTGKTSDKSDGLRSEVFSTTTRPKKSLIPKMLSPVEVKASAPLKHDKKNRDYAFVLSLTEIEKIRRGDFSQAIQTFIAKTEQFEKDNPLLKFGFGDLLPQLKIVLEKLQADPNYIFEMNEDGCHEFTLFVLNYLPIQERLLLAMHQAFGNQIAKLRRPVKNRKPMDPNPKVLTLGFVSSKNPLRSVVSHFMKPLVTELKDSPDFKLGLFDHALKSFDDKNIKPKDVDILIDLDGHTNFAQTLKLFYQRHFPVQMTWLGYPNTTGLSTIGYRIVSKFSDPPEWKQDERYAEKLLRLPDTFLCFAGTERYIEPEPPFKKNGYVTFACTNNPLKINLPTIHRIKVLLDNFEKSRIVFRYSSYCHNKNSALAIKKLCEAAAIAPGRVTFTYVLDVGILSSYNNYDICIDPTPYSGTVTTNETSWMGVGTLTYPMLRGHRANVTSMIHTMVATAGPLDTTKLIATSDEDLVKKAKALFEEVEIEFDGVKEKADMLTHYRKHLRNQFIKSPMGDTKLFAKNFTQAIRDAWKETAAEPQRMK